MLKNIIYAVILIALFIIQRGYQVHTQTMQYHVVLKSVVDNIFRARMDVLGPNSGIYSYTHIEFEVDNKYIISPESVNQSTITRCTGGWIRVSSGSTVEQNTLTPGENGCRTIKATIQYADIEDYYRQSIISGFNLEEFRKKLVSKFGKNITFNVTISYVSSKYYKDLPVNVFTINGSIRGKHKDFGLINGYIKGVVYLHMGLLIPVKGEVSYSIRAYAIGKEYNMTIEMKFDVKEHDLPSESIYGYDSNDEIEVIVGGLPGSSISVEVKGGSNKIVARNTGTDYGYVLVMLKKETPLYTEFYKGYYMKSYRVYVIPPNSSRDINVGVQLSEDMRISSREYVSTNIDMLTVFAVIAIVVVIVGIGWIFKMRRQKHL